MIIDVILITVTIARFDFASLKERVGTFCCFLPVCLLNSEVWAGFDFASFARDITQDAHPHFTSDLCPGDSSVSIELCFGYFEELASICAVVSGISLW
jgi:hypothetical protein